MSIRLGILLFCALLVSHLSAQTEVIVEFASAKTLVAAKEKLSASASRSADQAIGLIWYTLQSAGDRNIAVVTSSQTVAGWEAASGVIRVLESEPIEPRSRIPNDPAFSDQWDMEQIEAPGAWEYTTGGSSFSGREIVIGVIENNGFQLDHPDLQGNIFTNTDEIAGDGIDNDNNGLVDDITGWNFFENRNNFDNNTHGTHVLGTLGAKGDNSIQAVGMNWNIKMAPTQVNTLPQWVMALDYLTTLRRKYNQSEGVEGAYVVVANMSIGYPSPRTCGNDTFDAFINDAFNRAGEQGILCVGATSNDFENLDERPDLSSDCSSDYLVIVTASDRQDDIFGSSGYSTTDVDIAAPGARYRTIDAMVSGNIFNTFSGTSGATPHVAGAIALAYSIDCPTLDEISLIDPAGAALIVKDALLTTGDDAVGNAALSTSGKRLNVRRMIEQLLQEDCLLGDLIVQFGENETPPATLNNSAGEVSLVRTLSQNWNIHLYTTSGGVIADHVTQIEGLPSVLAAEPNVRFTLRGRQPNDPGYPLQNNLDAIGADEAWQTIYGASGNPPPSRVVTAIFDQNFNLNTQDLEGRLYANNLELANNGIDDDGNGYVDDNSGYNLTSRSNNFSEGNHGFAVASIIASNANNGIGIAGVDWAGKVLPLQGNSLGQWVEGASYVATLRSAYNASMGTAGALVASYVTPQGGTLLRKGGTLLTNVLDSLSNTGVLAIGAVVNNAAPVDTDFPTSIMHDGLLNVGFAFAGEFNGDDRGFSESNLPLFIPADHSAYGLLANDTLRLSGSSAASALAAGSVALLYQTPCADFETQAYLSPKSTATRMKRALYRSANTRLGGYRQNFFQLSNAAQQVTNSCEVASDCSILSLFPNPITSGENFRFELISDKTTATCPVSIYDPLGRVIFRENIAIQGGYIELNVDYANGLANGLYYLTAGQGKASESFPFVLAK